MKTFRDKALEPVRALERMEAEYRMEVSRTRTALRNCLVYVLGTAIACTAVLRTAIWIGDWTRANDAADRSMRRTMHQWKHRTPLTCCLVAASANTTDSNGFAGRS